jgi:hypothetical protein
VLFLDNGTSRLKRANDEAVASGRRQGDYLPPHVTHILHPIDVVIARAFKAAIAQFHSDIHLEDLPDFLPDPAQLTAIAIQPLKFVCATVSAFRDA